MITACTGISAAAEVAKLRAWPARKALAWGDAVLLRQWRKLLS